MFTGIVETQALVSSRRRDKLIVLPRNPLKGLAVGESVSVSGCCLTVDQIVPPRIHFRLLPETARVSTLGWLRMGDRVNLERALRLGSRLGGHLLLGHVDGQGDLVSRSETKGTVTLGIEVPMALRRFFVPKGPIGVDGVGLTLGPKIEGRQVFVHLIPHTLSVTTLGKKRVDDRVNLEVDLVAKYLWRML
jgi:riboflavin synthase